MIQVRIPLTPRFFSAKFVFEKDENKQKGGRRWPILYLKNQCRYIRAPQVQISVTEKVYTSKYLTGKWDRTQQEIEARKWMKRSLAQPRVDPFEVVTAQWRMPQ